MVYGISGNVKPGLSPLENEAVDARAVMHLVSAQGDHFGAELCSVSCHLGLGELFCASCVAAHGMATSC